jgi:L-serine dehydratase
MILKYNDRKGIISKISSILSNNELNIATMKVTRDKNIATMICEMDTELPKNIIDEISSLNEISYARFINPVRS